MFPYPSGAGLHVGHVKGYLATDIIARYKKMKGFSVLHPIGWDAFGLPAEQFANLNKKPPQEFTQQNINNFRRELNALFFSYDPELEINSTDPEYYKQTQWIFIQLYKRGLASLEKREVNWVDELQTVLANEEIYQGEDGLFYSERGDHLVQKRKLTQWVLKITEYAEELNASLAHLHWPEKIKTIQSEWIGEQEVYQLELKIKDRVFYHYESELDKIRSISGFLIDKESEIYSLLELEQEPKDGEILFYYSDSKTLQKLPFKFSVSKLTSGNPLEPIYEELIGNKRLPSFFNWKLLPKVKRFKLQDWVFSRQRYWGEPIPIYYDSENNFYIEESLPLKLPEYKPITTKTSEKTTPLEYYEEWLFEKEGFRRDANTMPNWAASSWYYLAYLIKQKEGYLPLDSSEAKRRIERWMPVDLYIGGQEHATMHLLYARFWYKVLYSTLGLQIEAGDEPFYTLKNQGMILGENGKKMSKSKNNFVSISSLLQEFGGDVIRLSVAFLGPLELTQYWDSRQLPVFQQWIEKLYRYFSEVKDSLNPKKSSPTKELVTFLSKLEYSIQAFKFNVLVSELMVFFKYLQKALNKNWLEHSLFIQSLSLVAPCIAEELWRELLKQETSLFNSSWPSFSTSFEEETLNYSIQLNGKHKLMIQLPSSLKTEQELFNHFSSLPEYPQLLKENKLEKYVVIPRKVINLITFKSS
ncbi:leucyl-tRNA ligase [Mycoplasma wenyonii str. Massachusetts]|uniref:leucine--tRNA ligase n=1 Tax=Mycoplasma wenyonii (strain Massachusetts) TaxID=1197325 RepID=I6YAJ1_MYCWM|nr:class I tRNA ligase family protein [Mycoplasma wenyonii]AFN64966.1 leucyl-tRNA ligase [Mycoplasma wenyonii str. Massachusetts]